MASSVLSMAWKNHERNRGDVAAWREIIRPHATTRRRDERLKVFDLGEAEFLATLVYEGD